MGQWVVARTSLGAGSSIVQQRVVASQALVPATNNHWSVLTNHRHCDVAFAGDVRRGSDNSQGHYP